MIVVIRTAVTSILLAGCLLATSRPFDSSDCVLLTLFTMLNLLLELTCPSKTACVMGSSSRAWVAGILLAAFAGCGFFMVHDSKAGSSGVAAKYCQKSR